MTANVELNPTVMRKHAEKGAELGPRHLRAATRKPVPVPKLVTKADVQRDERFRHVDTD